MLEEVEGGLYLLELLELLEVLEVPVDALRTTLYIRRIFSRVGGR